jgi:uncharacterized protein (TIGR00255 family)
MIQSMTGYGKASVATPGYNLTVEIKALNSKQLDLNLKLPSFLREKEMELRNLVSQRLERGKVDLLITTEATGENSGNFINRAIFRQYYQELTTVAAELGVSSPPDIMSIVIRMPDVMITGKDETLPADPELLLNCFDEALLQVVAFRQQEGKTLEDDMLQRVHAILQLLDQIAPHEKQRVTSVRERMIREFARYSEEGSGPVADQNRFEQELIYYLEKLDFTEEKVRLWKHCGYFLETLKESGNQGKKLGFVTQEMGREINTIGSKANDADIQRLVVQMKDELEKIKEQLGNIL